MGALADALGRSAGELIRAADWNALIAAVEDLETSLTEQIATLSDSVDARFTAVNDTLGELSGTVTTLQGTAEELQGRADALEDSLATLRGRFRRVTMNTARSDYAVGEMAEITARITALDGTALDLSDPATRPWIDFVTAWGQLRPVAGFESRGGAGDRTISVRVDASGEARVLLRAEHAEGFGEDTEAEVAATLSTVLPGTGISVGQSFLQSATPMEARERGVFQVMSAEYTRGDAFAVRDYVDAYYVRNPSLATGLFAPNFHHRWRDYRATVLAFAKSDGDPRTPDPSLGTCSIQVNFRDWIGPWINLDFFADLDDLVLDYSDRFAGRIGESYTGTVIGLQDEMEEIVRGKGLVGKYRDYRAILEAVDQVEVTDPPEFLGDLKQNVKNGIQIQQSAEYAQSVGIGLGEGLVAFQALTSTGTRAETRAGEVGTQVAAQVEQQFAETQEQLLFQVQQEQANFRNELLAEDGLIQDVQRNLQVVSGQVQGFQQALNGKADIQTLARFLPG